MKKALYSGWVILVDQAKDFPNADTPHKVITTRDYLARPQLFDGGRPKVVNLSRSYAYQSRGYFCSLLAEARGHRVLPSVEAMLDLAGRELYGHAIPELEQELNRCARSARHTPERETSFQVCMGLVADERYERFARLLFDWFRCPIIEVTVTPGDWLTIRRLRPRAITKLDDAERAFFREALHRHTLRDWRSPRTRPTLKYSLAVLHDPKQALAPSTLASIRHFARIAERHDIEVEPITRKQLDQLAEYDALFIRETTSIDNHTYRFARRAVQEGMPVIDDPISMIRCTNKVYLKELLTANGVPVPPTVIVASAADIAAAEERLGYPLVVKIPDGSFSRGVHKVETPEAFRKLAGDLFKETDLLIAQKFMQTEFDWRLGVLGGEPLFACQYLMARRHWQIVKHRPDGSAIQGSSRAFAFEDVPEAVIDVGVRAARLIGDGLYGVDIKQNADGVFVIEINDNPNVDHGYEDAALKDQVWSKLARWFYDRLEM
ncbi:glutathione synthase/RimK-type ligase-like ATP-grasp enzyme [Tepidamorphus gemmatus]|uniref:Glutathione synthase/RimK-type ligase-like ATP-grasp enzyme n=1 Tax=Tepidamorphus gemmatus TaxID=747076 RepID=A0A4R3M6Z4_9HYPH|nr:RimK family protein [Tepidamorphus gemmatus]TCT09211.1 glutathione synthase/RimK-type ligase-like ATP-grasp enzyme [Tepidamorphus gemmatus]